MLYMEEYAICANANALTISGFIFLIGLFLMLAIVLGSKNYVYSTCIFVILTIVVFFGGIIYLCEEIPQGNTYYVTIDEGGEIDWSRYVFVEQKGDLYIIRDKCE